LIEWYASLLAKAAQNLDVKTADMWLAVLRAPMDIRGYGPVKEEALERVRRRVANMLQATTTEHREAA